MNTLYQTMRQLKANDHKARVTPALVTELRWWLSCLTNNVHCRQIWYDQRHSQTFFTDSSNVGAGAFHSLTGSWIYKNWILDRPQIAKAHINIKELAMVDRYIRPPLCGAAFRISQRQHVNSSLD
jgi:hypothetical protein